MHPAEVTQQEALENSSLQMHLMSDEKHRHHKSAAAE